MRAWKGMLWIAVLAVALAPAAGAGCNKDHEGTEAAVKIGCPKTAARAAMLASNAAEGCAESRAALIAIAKNCDCPDTVALAIKAEKGDEKATAELIARFAGKKDREAPATEAEPTLAQLASWAEQGCAKSTAAMIARAKASGDEELARLAGNAEGGCEKSKAALIASLKEAPANEEATR